MRCLVAFTSALLASSASTAATHDLSWSEVVRPAVTVAFVAGRCVVLVTGAGPTNQPKISERAVHLEGATAVMSIHTGAVTDKGSTRNFQLVVPTATPGLVRVVFGPERSIIWQRDAKDSPCGG